MARKQDIIVATGKTTKYLHCGQGIVRNYNLSLQARGLYLLLRTYCSEDHPQAFPSIRKLKQLTKLSMDKVIDLTNELIKHGFISKSKAPSTINGQYERNIYTLFVDKEYEMPFDLVEREKQSKTKEIQNPIKEDEKPFDSIDSTKTNIVLTITSNIYSFWNDQNIITHKKFTDSISRKIKSALKDYTEQEIKTSISNYAHILNSNEYFFNYRWTLIDFLQRGIEKFRELETAKNNYRVSSAIKKSYKPEELYL